TSRSQATSRSCRYRRVRPSSTAKKTFGSSCGRTGSQTASSNPSTTSSTTAAMLGTHSSISHGKSCPSPIANGRSSVTNCEDWYSTPSQRLLRQAPIGLFYFLDREDSFPRRHVAECHTATAPRRGCVL